MVYNFTRDRSNHLDWRGGAEGQIMRATTLYALSEDQSIQGTIFDGDAKLFE